MSAIRSKLNITLTQILFTAVRFVQFALALTVCGLYGVDLNNARKEKKYVDSKWVRKPSLQDTFPSLLCP